MGKKNVEQDKAYLFTADINSILLVGMYNEFSCGT